MNISFKDETEVFEYPSYESSKDPSYEDQDPEPAPPTVLKTNTPLGTAGIYFCTGSAGFKLEIPAFTLVKVL